VVQFLSAVVAAVAAKMLRPLLALLFAVPFHLLEHKHHGHDCPPPRTVMTAFDAGGYNFEHQQLVFLPV